MKTDIFTDNNNNFDINSAGDMVFFTSVDVNMQALRNELNSLKQSILDNNIDYDTVNKIIIQKAFLLQLNPLNIVLSKEKYLQGIIDVQYTLTGENNGN